VKSETKIFICEQHILYPTEYYEKLREQRILAIECHMYFWEVAGLIFFWMCMHKL